MIHELNNLFRPARMSRTRMALALFVAMAADALQIVFPLPPATEIIDVIAAVLTVALLGFHVLLLPTFILEFIPGVGLLPTWSGCVAAVIVMRKRSERPPPIINVPPPIPHQKQLPDSTPPS
jgi:hypothetical protein